MKKFFGMKAKYVAISKKPSGKPGGIQKVRVEQRAGPKPKTLIAPLVGPVRRGRAYQTRYGRDVRRGGRGHIRRNIRTDIETYIVEPLRGRRGRTRETATVSIPQSPAFVPLEIFSVKSEKKKQHGMPRVRDTEAPLGTVKRGRKKTGLSIR